MFLTLAILLISATEIAFTLNLILFNDSKANAVLFISLNHVLNIVLLILPLWRRL